MRDQLAVCAALVMALACSPHAMTSAGGDDALLGPDMGDAWCGCAGGGAAPPSAMASILIFGDAALGSLRAGLEALGHTVTVDPILPEDLLPFDVIWHVGNTEPLTLEQQVRLAAFVRGGRGLHLTGERLGGDVMNDSLGALVNALVAGGGIQVGRRGDIRPPGTFFSPYPVNPAALGGIASTPNAVPEIHMKVPGGLAGVAGGNVLVRGVGGVPVGAVWEGSDLACGTGALSIVMDNGWLELIPYQARNRLLVENLQAFLHRLPGDCSGDDYPDAGAGDHDVDGYPDDDGDGVPDYCDLCPGTSAGTIVDERGCSIG